MNTESKQPRVILFANHLLGKSLIQYLKQEQQENIVGLVVHPPHQSHSRDDIVEIADMNASDILSPDTLEDEWISNWIKERQPDVICSFWSSYIFTKEIIDMIPLGIINLHNSLLPWARGSAANIFTILENCPAGVSLHYISEHIDKGNIIDQTEVPCASWDSGKTYFHKQLNAMTKLFKKNWPTLRENKIEGQSQKGKGSFHYHYEANALREIKLDQSYSGRELINLLRAFSFTPYDGCYFVDENGDKINLHLELNRGMQTIKKSI